jgi:hypothetical protein
MRVKAGPTLIAEADFLQLITDAAELYGWRWAHWRPARTRHGWRTPVSGPLGKGWPDLMLIRDRDGRMLWAELKRAGAMPDPDQSAVLDYLRRFARFHGWASVHVWRPDDWDEIVETLK